MADGTKLAAGEAIAPTVPRAAAKLFPINLTKLSGIIASERNLKLSCRLRQEVQ